jgi:CPA2 family monovalent cation:H+ antiporter-2
VRRRNIRNIAPEPGTQVEEGDVLVLLGAEADLAAAEIKLMQG